MIKHTSEKKAAICLNQIENQLQITVEDRGKGFDSKVDDLTSIKEGRFGLFSIIERIDLIGGRVNIEAKSGYGTKITLYVPLARDNKHGIETEKTEEGGQVVHTGQKEAKDKDKIKVLLVDDHEMVRKGFRKLIEEQDDIIIVGEAADGKEAVTLARKFSPDIIVMDVSMPVMDGIEATRKITSEMSDISIIGLSLHEEKEVAGEMRKAGAAAYITKTEAFQYLIVTIRAEAPSKVSSG